MANEQALQTEIEDLRARLTEAEDTLDAIRTGQVDAVVVQGPEGHTVYTLTGAERVYRLLVEAMNEGALVLSPGGSVIYSNHTFASMLGLPLEQVIGSSVYEYVAPADVDSVKQLLQQAVWAPGRREISFNREDRTQVPAHISVGSLDVEEAAESLSAVVTDLTEHKALECELEQYRVHLEDLVKQRTTQLQETVGQLRVMMMARKDAEEALARSNAELASANEELRAMNEEQRVANEALQQEIENRGRTETALQQTEADLKRAQAVAQTGSWRMDIRRDELSWSDEAHRLFGIPKETPLTFESFLSCVHPDDRAAVYNAWQDALQGAVYSIEHRIMVGGTVKWVQETAELEFTPDGELLGAFGTVQDISERKQIEHEKDDLLRREHRIAEALQGALIPTQVPRSIETWSVAARYRPALREAQVGGDFYDVFRLDDERFGVIIGDIAGKGLAAAIRVSAIRHAIRSYAYVEPSPGKVITLVNDALYREETDEQNVLTVVYAVVRSADNAITYANAGHEPPIIRTPSGDMDELGVTGPMLGVLPGFRYEEQELHLEPGCEIIMFTDGITEARTDADLFQREGVIDELTKMTEATPDEIAETLLQAATLHAGGDLQDDAAIVVLEYEGVYSG